MLRDLYVHSPDPYPCMALLSDLSELIGKIFSSLELSVLLRSV